MSATNLGLARSSDHPAFPALAAEQANVARLQLELADLRHVHDEVKWHYTNALRDLRASEAEVRDIRPELTVLRLRLAARWAVRAGTVLSAYVLGLATFVALDWLAAEWWR